MTDKQFLNYHRNYNDKTIMLGEELGIYDTVNRTDEKYDELYRRTASLMWQDDEFDFNPCKKEFAKKDTEAQMMVETLSYQWEADSVASMAILPVFAPFITDNDLQRVMAFNTMMEMTHSSTYANIVRDSFENPHEVMDEILSNKGALERVGYIDTVMKDVFIASHKYALGEMSKEEAFGYAYKGMVGLLLLERLQFIASFAITFALGEAGRFTPIAMAVRKICADELCHSECDVLVLRDLRKTDYWNNLYKDNSEYQESIKKAIDDVVQGEMEWTEYLFRDNRTLTGVNEKLIKDWVHYNAQVVYKECGFEAPVKVKDNPLPWMDNWMSTANHQPAPQEEVLVSYLKGRIDDDISEDLSNFI